NLEQLAQLEALQDFFERGTPERRIGIARAAEPELGVGPRVDVARRDGHAELGEKSVARALGRLHIKIPVQRFLEHALMHFDGVYASRLRAPALPLEVVAEVRIVGVISRGREAVAKIAGRPVTHAVSDVEGLEEFN